VRGASPLTLTLPAGAHRIALAARLHALLGDDHPGCRARGHYAPDLEDVEPPVVTIAIDTFQVAWQGQAHVRAVASDNAGVLDIELALRTKPWPRPRKRAESRSHPGGDSSIQPVARTH